MLDDHFDVVLENFADIFGEVDAPPLAAGVRLADVDSLALGRGGVLQEFLALFRKSEGLREKAVLFREVSRHSLQVVGELVFFAEVLTAGEMVDLLVGEHPLEVLLLDVGIYPGDIPVVSHDSEVVAVS